MENLYELITAVSTSIIATILIVERMPIVNRIRNRIKLYGKGLAFRLRTTRNKVRLMFKRK